MDIRKYVLDQTVGGAEIIDTMLTTMRCGSIRDAQGAAEWLSKMLWPKLSPDAESSDVDIRVLYASDLINKP